MGLLAKECGWPLETGNFQEMDSTIKPPEVMSTADTLILAQWNWFWISDLHNYKKVKFVLL